MKGKAYLIGAGPGRADLITARGLSLIRQADVIIYDRLISPELLDEAPQAEKIFAGKNSGHHAIPQEEINALLVEKVRQGKCVARLKGGDPFVFGRGGEEALALMEAGLPFEIVPGVSSAIAAPAYAGIPVTHRGIATSFAVVTGHESPDKLETTTNWRDLSKIHTLVILMGIENFGRISQILMEAGRDPNTPAAAIRQGTTSHQRLAVATLSTLAEVIEAQDITSPAVIVIGDVVTLAHQLAWRAEEHPGAGLVSMFTHAPHDEIKQGENVTKREIVLLGHGSRMQAAVDEFNLFAEALSRHIEQPVRVGFLELSEPEISVALAQAARDAGDGGEVLVVPMFLGAAYHMKAEISHIVHHAQEDFPNTMIKYSTPLGFHIKLAELLKIRVDAALAATPNAKPAEETTVLVVGGGSSDLDSNSSVSKVARALYEIGNYENVEVAYQRVTRPTTAEGIERVYKLGAKQVVVIPFLLFTGIVHQKTVIAANETAQRLGMELIHANYLGPKHPLLIDVTVQRLLEAENGISEMLRHKAIEGISQVMDDGHGHHH